MADTEEQSKWCMGGSSHSAYNHLDLEAASNAEAFPATIMTNLGSLTTG